MAGKRAHLALRAGEPHEPRAAASAQAPAPSQGDLEPDREGEAEGVHADPPAHVLLAEPCEGRGRPGTWQEAVRQAGSDRRTRRQARDRSRDAPPLAQLASPPCGEVGSGRAATAAGWGRTLASPRSGEVGLLAQRADRVGKDSWPRRPPLGIKRATLDPAALGMVPGCPRRSSNARQRGSCCWIRKTESFFSRYVPMRTPCARAGSARAVRWLPGRPIGKPPSASFGKRSARPLWHWVLACGCASTSLTFVGPDTDSVSASFSRGPTRQQSIPVDWNRLRSRSSWATAGGNSMRSKAQERQSSRRGSSLSFSLG